MFTSKKFQRRSTLGIGLIIIFLIFVSFKRNSEHSMNAETDLLVKINAVQEQIMAQGDISKEEEIALASLCSIVSHNDGLANFSPEYRMILNEVDVAPVFEGCQELSAEETLVCFESKLAFFIKREFNLSLVQNLRLEEPKQVDVFFIIDDRGQVTGMKVRNSEIVIQAEILRVLRKLPVMEPAIFNQKNTSVLCSMVLTYGDSITIDLVFIPERPLD